MPRGGAVFGQGAKSMVGGGKKAAARLVDAFRSLGIKPPAGAVSGSRALGTIEKALESAPFSAGIMQKHAEAVLSQDGAGGGEPKPGEASKSGEAPSAASEAGAPAAGESQAPEPTSADDLPF